MEGHTTFINWKIQYFKDLNSLQSNLQIQYNPNTILKKT